MVPAQTGPLPTGFANPDGYMLWVPNRVANGVLLAD